MEAGAEQAQGLMQIVLVLVASVRAAKLDALGEEVPHVPGAGHNPGPLVGNVVLQTRLLINSQLDALIHGATKPAVVLGGILVIGVVLGVVDV